MSEDDSSENDSGIHACVGEPSCECGAFNKLATTVETRVDLLHATIENGGLVSDKESMDDDIFAGLEMGSSCSINLLMSNGGGYVFPG